MTVAGRRRALAHSQRSRRLKLTPTWIVYVLMMATSTIAVIDLLLLSTMIPR